LKVKCHSCGELTVINRFCGNCGSQIAFETIHESNEIPMVSNLTNKHSKNKRKDWAVGVTAFLLIWIFGGVLLSIFSTSAGLDERYVGAICFVLGLVAMFAIVHERKEGREVELQENKPSIKD
jgi:small neutral amino acid transporter SnatA (MarC family)